MNLAPYRKFAAAVVTAVAAAAVTWLSTGRIDSTVIGTLITALAGAGAVYLVPNQPPGQPSTLTQAQAQTGTPTVWIPPAAPGGIGTSGIGTGNAFVADTTGNFNWPGPSVNQ